MSKTLRPLAALAMVALISAACSNAAAETGTGSSGGNNTAATHQQAVKFAECMRANGVKDFPDPTPDGPLLNVDGSKPGLKAALDAAMQKCRDLAANAGARGGR